MGSEMCIRDRIITLDTVDSTNAYAFRLAEKGEPEIIAVRALHQSQGRGRRDNVWISPKNVGIYASFLLQPTNALSEIVWLPLFFSYTVVHSLEPLVKATIKWPNDILINNKKVGGVLIEAKSTGQRTDFVIAGIGLNVNSRPDQLPTDATSLYMETKKTYEIDEMFEKILATIISIYNEFKKGNIEVLQTKALSTVKQKQAVNKLAKKYSKKNMEDLIILR